MPRKKSGEGIQQYEAFETWFWMHPRSFDKLAEGLKVTSSIVRVWHAKYRWEERAEEREKKIKTDLANKNDAEAVKQRSNIINVMQATMARYAARLLKDPAVRDQHGVTQYEPTAADAVRAAQLQIVLGGGATSRTDITMGSGFTDALLAMVGATLRRELPTCCPNCRADLGGLPGRISMKLIEAASGLAADAAAAVPVPLAGSVGRAENPDEAGPE
ncbi:MAG: hypothetical protein KGZ65_04165 [Sphingomonadales bacterium]|nr:hypothetical protein [Sphingomonadaceae bacterium]MBS3930408.1 hypothetical protein [Sphingomonadales bacterium]